MHELIKMLTRWFRREDGDRGRLILLDLEDGKELKIHSVTETLNATSDQYDLTVTVGPE